MSDRDDVIASSIVDDALDLIKNGTHNHKTLASLEQKWRSEGASVQACKVARLLIAECSHLRQTDQAQFETTLRSLPEAIKQAEGLSALPLQGKGREEQPSPPVVLILHGIKTLAPWMDEVANELRAAGFRPVPLDYDVFSARQLLRKGSRRGKADWLRRQYERVCKENGNCLPSIIAHSFGTYLAAQAIRIYGMKFDRVIFCGAIVSRDYPWSAFIQQGLVGQVLNDYGRQDFWARIVAWVVEDAGQSGYAGFRDTANGKVIQIQHLEFRHSDYFFRTNYTESWIPFLKKEDQNAFGPLPLEKTNWRFKLAVATLVLGFGIVLYWLFNG